MRDPEIKQCEYCGEPHTRRGKYCKDSCKTMAWRNRKQTVNNQTVNSIPDTREYNKTLTVGRHNIGVYFLIEGDDYYFDTKVTWKLIKTKGGESIGKYTHAFIRDALGFPYDPAHKGQRPPLSVVKGRYTNKVEVFINEGAGIDSQEKLIDMLGQIKDILETDFGAQLSGPYAKKFKDTGEDITDYTVPCPLAKKFGQDHPDEIPFKAEAKEGDTYENARIDGSHPKAWETRNRQQAEDIHALREDAGVTNPGDIEQAELVSRETNILEHVRMNTANLYGVDKILFDSIKQSNSEVRTDLAMMRTEQVSVLKQKLGGITEEVRAIKAGNVTIERAIEGLIESNIRMAHITEEIARPDLVPNTGPGQMALLEIKQEFKAEKTKREKLEDRLKAIEGKSRWQIFLDYLRGDKG